LGGLLSTTHSFLIFTNITTNSSTRFYRIILDP
jgi:hypothetical protein